MLGRSSLLVVVLLAACASGGARRPTAVGGATTVTPADVHAVEDPLADDSMEGRGTGRPGSM
jgi:hypothetical protein